jgi:hypothetical protein
MRLSLALLLTLSAQAQTIPWIDLSGPWQMSAGDNPAFAAPEFDDRSWSSLHVPLGNETRSRGRLPERYWLRRRVDLPADSDRSRLTVTIGAISPFFEVFVNGDFLGRSSPFDLKLARLARPYTFDVPATAAAKQDTLLVAVRVWRPFLHGTLAWSLPDEGPWLVTDRMAAPRQAGEEAIRRQFMGRVSNLAQAFPLLCVAVIALLFWLVDRRRREFLWLSIYTAWIGIGRLDLQLQIHPEARPFRWGFYQSTLEWSLAPAALLAQFAATTVARRWLAQWVWPLAFVTAFATVLTRTWNVTHAGVWAIELLTLAALAQAILVTPRDPAWQPRVPRYSVAAGLAAILSFHGMSWADWGGLGLPDYRVVFPYGVSINTHPVSVAVLSFLFILFQVRSVLSKRLRLATEFEAARAMQQLLQRDAQVRSGALSLEAVYRPAQEVGGDFYQVAELDGGALLVLVGDVSGKGLKAAMAASLLCGAFRNRRSDAPSMVLANLNRAAMGVFDGGFATAAVVRCDANGEAQCALAGHPAPWLDGREIEAEAGLPLGLVAGAEWSETAIRIESGLALVSDGVIEAANAKGDLFGFDRTRELSGKSAQEIAEAARAWGQNDDITVVAVRRLG